MTTSCRTSASISTAWTARSIWCSQTTRKAYPSFEVPFHSRWRHFVMNGDNRWADIANQGSLARSRRPRPG
ncbi:MAG: DUF1688 family protein [Bradyrhizobium sp.]